MTNKQILDIFDEYMKNFEETLNKMNLGKEFELTKKFIFPKIKVSFTKNLRELEEKYKNFVKEKYENSDKEFECVELKIFRMKLFIDFVDKNEKLFKKSLDKINKKWWHII